MDDDIRQILESWSKASKWDESFDSFRKGVNKIFDLNYPVLSRQIEFLRNKQAAEETPLKFLERVMLESETCDFDNIDKQKLTMLVLLNGLLDEKVTFILLFKSIEILSKQGFQSRACGKFSGKIIKDTRVYQYIVHTWGYLFNHFKKISIVQN